MPDHSSSPLPQIACVFFLQYSEISISDKDDVSKTARNLSFEFHPAGELLPYGSSSPASLALLRQV
jgi:hypothetical protein